MARSTSFQIEQAGDGAAVLLSLRGELDMSTTGQLTDRLAQELKGGAEEVTLDLSELAFMDSTGLRVLIELHDQAKEERWRLHLVAPQHEAALLVINSTGADEALPFVAAGEP